MCYIDELCRGLDTPNSLPSVVYSRIIHPQFFVKQVFMSPSNLASCVLQLSASSTLKLCTTDAPTIVLVVLEESFQSTPSMRNVASNDGYR